MICKVKDKGSIRNSGDCTATTAEDIGPIMGPLT